MKLGIKVGPKNDWKKDIEATHPAMVEVWFDVSRASEYGKMFAYLKTQPLDVGLHFWGALADGTMATITYPDERVTEQSMALIRRTIDIAAENHCVYVNIHTGSYALYTVDFKNLDYAVTTKPADMDRCMNQFIKNYATLDAYAKSKNVVLTIETVSRLVQKTDWYNAESRSEPFEIYQIPIEANIQAAKCGFSIANDFAHTATQMKSGDPAVIWEFLKEFTHTYAAQTRLIHLGFLIPPFNGTDHHGMLDNPILESISALPNKKQMIELLQEFKHRDDVWILVEPKENHVKNYFLAKEILETASQI